MHTGQLSNICDNNFETGESKAAACESQICIYGLLASSSLLLSPISRHAFLRMVVVVVIVIAIVPVVVG